MNSYIEHERLLSPGIGVSESQADKNLRPKSFPEYLGQDAVKEQMGIFVEAARLRGEALDHVLMFGPPGLGKTTLAHVVAFELGAGFQVTSGPILTRPGDLAAILSQLEAKTVLFIDEIHRMQPAVEELLYSAMEDYHIDVLLGQGAGARSMRIQLPPFTLIGATTRAGALTAPLRERFGIIQRLEYYNIEALALIIQRSARILHMNLEEGGVHAIASRARGTPRIANRLLRRVRDVVEVRGISKINAAHAHEALNMLKVDELGLDHQDRRLLEVIKTHFSGGPVGLDSLSVALGESRDTVEDVIEPYLIQQGMLQRTAKGRVTTIRAREYLESHGSLTEIGNSSDLTLFSADHLV